MLSKITALPRHRAAHSYHKELAGYCYAGRAATWRDMLRTFLISSMCCVHAGYLHPSEHVNSPHGCVGRLPGYTMSLRANRCVQCGASRSSRTYVGRRRPLKKVPAPS